MFDLGPEKIIVFLVIAFLVLGPGRLGEVARGLGKAMGQLRQWSDGLSPETSKLIRNPRGAIFDVLDEPRQAMADTAAAMRAAMVPTESPTTDSETTQHLREEVAQ